MVDNRKKMIYEVKNIEEANKHEEENLNNNNIGFTSFYASDEPEDGVINIACDQQNAVIDRGGWSGKLDFLMTCVGYAVGLGNVWRFPYLCYSNGGGAFLIPYIIMLSFLGLPLFFMEFAFGQFASLGPISIWYISPMFKGIGYTMVMLSWILVVYYQVIVAQCLHFLVSSMTSVLPWSSCDPSWSTPNCIDNFTGVTNLQNSTSPSSDYYYYNVLQKTSSIEEYGNLSWQLTLYLLLAWIISALATIKGVQSLGKVSYFTGVFPYIMLTILLIRGLFLPGSLDGIKFYVTPDFGKLKDPAVWVQAATQIFFSLGCCTGGLIAMSSFNKFKNNCCRDAVLVALLNCATSVYAGFVIFANLGFMANAKNTTVGNVVETGPGLAFIVYPEAILNMPLPTLWAILFFFMMATLGFGSSFSILETVISGIQDELRRYGVLFTTAREVCFRIVICVASFLAGLPMVFGGGYYLFYLVDHFISTYPLLIVALIETVVISYVYGLRQFRRDIELMINERPNWYWRICWPIVTPIICFSLIIFYFVKGEELTIDGYKYPQWALVFGNILVIIPLSMIPIMFLYRYCKEGGFILLKEFLKPVHQWGPAHKENRAEFMSMIKSNESLHRSRINETSQGNLISAISGLNLTGTGVLPSTGWTGSLVSGLAGTGALDESKFFQSKLNVAEKLTQAHTKEIVKRVTSTADFASIDALGLLTASQTALATAAATSLVHNYVSTTNDGYNPSHVGLDSVKLPEQIEESNLENENKSNSNAPKDKTLLTSYVPTNISTVEDVPAPEEAVIVINKRKI